MAEQPIKLFATRSENYPQPDGTDKAVGAVRIALAASDLGGLGGLGGTINEFLSMVLRPALDRRRDDWFRELADAIDGLEAEVAGFKVESLENDEVFISATVQATRIAMGTNQKEKREMLRKALLNIGVGKGPSEEMQQIFFGAIETFTPSHVKVLKFYWTGLADLDRAGFWDALRPYATGTYRKAITDLYPEMKGQDGLLQFIMTDLYNRGFSKGHRLDDTFSQSPAITNLGIEFLRLVLDDQQ